VAETTPPPTEPARDGSKGPAARFAEFRSAIGRSDPVALVVTALATVAALLLIMAEFSTIASIELTRPGESCDVQVVDPEQRDRCDLSGFERHGGSLVLLALLTGLMGWGAGVGRSRSAATALVGIGVLVVVVALAWDLPATNDTGAVGRNFEGAEARRGMGLYFEIVGGGLAILAGLRRLRARQTE
jgi:hypothetical protein